MKAIILTGATGGLGKALVDVLVGEKDTELICLYRNQRKYEELFQDRMESARGYLIKEKDDFSELEEWINPNRYENVVLILNAFSISPIKRIGDFTSEEIEGFIDGNLTRNVLLLNSVITICKKHSLGLRIINLDSGAADFPLTGWGNYCAAKAYMNSFISVVAAENPDYQVVSFDPGVINTNMQAEIRATDKSVFEQVDTFIGYKDENKLYEPADVAKRIKERYVSDWTTKSMREKNR